MGFLGAPSELAIFAGNNSLSLKKLLYASGVAKNNKVVSVEVVKFPAVHDFLVHHPAGLHPAAHAPGAAPLNDSAVLLGAAPRQQGNPCSALDWFSSDEFRAGKQGCWDVHVFHIKKASVGGCRFHKDQEDGLPAAVSEQRFMAGQFQNFRG